MRLRYASFSQKNGRARRQTRRGGASGGRDGPVGAAGLFDRGRGSEDDPLLLSPAAGYQAAPGCASWPMNAAGSAIAGCSCCCGGRASRPGSTGSTASIGRNGSLSASVGPAARRQGPGRRSWWTPSRTPAGPSTSSTISSPMDGASASQHPRRRHQGSLGAAPDTSISGRRVARELTMIVERRGKPGSIVSDNGTEFTCNAMLAWCKDTGSIGISSHRASAFVESFMYRRPRGCKGFQQHFGYRSGAFMYTAC